MNTKTKGFKVRKFEMQRKKPEKKETKQKLCSF